MKIDQPKFDSMTKEQAVVELRNIIMQPGAAQSPPCPGCKISPLNCSPKCPYAAEALSSDPDRYPIEPKVVPIVFEMVVLRLIQPCWSCEGHMTKEGYLNKYCQVAFYAASSLYPQLIVSYLSALEVQKKLAYQWQIVVNSFGQSLMPTYILKPDLNFCSDVRLGVLQQDLLTIAEKFSEHIKQQARDMVEVLEAA